MFALEAGRGNTAMDLTVNEIQNLQLEIESRLKDKKNGRSYEFLLSDTYLKDLDVDQAIIVIDPVTLQESTVRRQYIIDFCASKSRRTAIQGLNL